MFPPNSVQFFIFIHNNKQAPQCVNLLQRSEQQLLELHWNIYHGWREDTATLNN